MPETGKNDGLETVRPQGRYGQTGQGVKKVFFM